MNREISLNTNSRVDWLKSLAIVTTTNKDWNYFLSDPRRTAKDTA